MFTFDASEECTETPVEGLLMREIVHLPGGRYRPLKPIFQGLYRLLWTASWPLGPQSALLRSKRPPGRPLPGT